MTGPRLMMAGHLHRLPTDDNPTMSTGYMRADDRRTEQTTDEQFDLPAYTPRLIDQLDNAPNFVEVERKRTVRYKVDGVSKRDRLELADDDNSRIVDARYGGKFTKEVTELMLVSSDYEIDTRACHGSQADVASAWEDMKFPKHNIDRLEGITGAHIYTWSSTSQPRGRLGRPRGRGSTESTINYEAVQHPMGHGVIEHYDTIAAIRTKSDLVIVNEQDFGTGFARVTRPDDWDYELPLDGVDEIISGHPETLYDIENVTADKTRINYDTTRDPIGGHDIVVGVSRSRRNDRQTQMIEFSNGAAVVLLWDSTANNPDESKAGFRLAPEEAETVTTASDALDVLQPIDVQQAKEHGLDVLEADDYAGDGADFGGEQLGDAIIRQGEWYFIPMPDGWQPEVPIYKPLPVPNRDSSWEFPGGVTEHYDVADVQEQFPEECPQCGGTRWELEARKPEARCLDCDTCFLFGADHDPSQFVADEIAELYDMATDVLESHVPRDLAVTEDPDAMYVRGTVRHVDNEHQMINLDDRWHLAVDNTRDVTVFDLSADTGNGGVARWE